MKILSAILIIIAAAIVITLIRALFYKADVPTPESFPEERVDSKRVQEKLSGAIKIKTISNT